MNMQQQILDRSFCESWFTSATCHTFTGRQIDHDITSKTFRKKIFSIWRRLYCVEMKLEADHYGLQDHSQPRS
jgi:hypothetical protein